MKLNTTLARRRFLKLAAAAALIPAAPHVVRAQAGYPTRPVRFIVGQAAGSGSASSSSSKPGPAPPATSRPSSSPARRPTATPSCS